MSGLFTHTPAAAARSRGPLARHAMHAAFLAAIADRPDDDLPRLVYADWLDENGDEERAEFIRTQIELANLSPVDPRREALTARERELRRHGYKWELAEVQGRSQVFRRGFVELLNVSADWLVAHPRALVAPGPLRAVRVFNASAYIRRLTDVQGLGRIESLDLSNTQFAGPADVRAFFTSAHLKRLRELVLRNSNFWEGDELNALADTPVARQLRALDLSGNRVGNAGVRALATRPEFGGLEVLTFRADELEQHSCVTAMGARAIAESATLTRLRALDLGDHYLGDVGLRWLVNSPNAAGLERLGVEYNEIGEDGGDAISAVVQSTRLGNLRELRFGGNWVSRRGAEALAGWPHLGHMTLVDLRECPLPPSVRAILSGSPWADRFVF